MAALCAQSSGLGVKLCRDMLRGEWNSASAGVKSNAVWLMRRTELPPADNKMARCPKSPSHECYGCELTWQTHWGRGHDEISELFEKKLCMEDLTDLCRTCRPLRAAFEDFLSFVSRELVVIGMAYYSCSMELNSDNAQVA